MQKKKIIRFAQNAQRSNLPVDVEVVGSTASVTGQVDEATEETLTLRDQDRLCSIPLSRVEWIGFDLSGVDTGAIL